MGKSSFLQDFKAFAMRGNVIDMAVGVIIGGAFGKIVSSIVADVIMPPIGLLVGGYAFAVAFRAAKRDYPLVMIAATVGYLISRIGGELWGDVAGVFLGAFGMTVAGNLYARWMNRPGALIRLPGIILLVPGSVSFRGLISLMQQQDLSAGQAALMAVVNILMALIAGLMFGNLLLPPRRNL